MLADWGDAEKNPTDRGGVLVGTSKESDPSGNSVIVKGASESIVIDPRSLGDLVDHRFIDRPHVDNMLVMHVESRSADLHLARMLERGEASEVEPGRYRGIRA